MHWCVCLMSFFERRILNPNHGVFLITGGSLISCISMYFSSTDLARVQVICLGLNFKLIRGSVWQL